MNDAQCCFNLPVGFKEFFTAGNSDRERFASSCSRRRNGSGKVALRDQRRWSMPRELIEPREGDKRYIRRGKKDSSPAGRRMSGVHYRPTAARKPRPLRRRAKATGETGAPIEVLKRGASSHVPVAVLALALTNLSVDSLKVSALFHLLAPPMHMVGLGVVFP
jgi:hypothetical protein